MTAHQNVKAKWVYPLGILKFAGVICIALALNGCSKEAEQTTEMLSSASVQMGVGLVMAGPLADWKLTLNEKVKVYIETAKATGKRPPKAELLAEIGRFEDAVRKSTIMTYNYGTAPEYWRVEMETLQYFGEP